MQCANCRFDNGDGVQFCRACGSPMPSAGMARTAIGASEPFAARLPAKLAMIYNGPDGTSKPWHGDLRRRRKIGALLLTVAFAAAAASWVTSELFFSDELQIGDGWTNPSAAQSAPAADQSPGESLLAAAEVAPPPPPTAVVPPVAPAVGPVPEAMPDPMPKQQPQPPVAVAPVLGPAPQAIPDPMPKQQPQPPVAVSPALGPAAKEVRDPRPEHKAQPPAAKKVLQKPEKRPVSPAAPAHRATARQAPSSVAERAPEEKPRAPQPVARAAQEIVRPPPAPAVRAGAAWYADLQAQLRRCASRDNFISRIVCSEKAKFHFCGPGKHWGEVPECVQAQTTSDY